MRKPQVVLADDQPEVLAAIRTVLEPEFEVVATAPDGAALVDIVRELEPDLVVVDMAMPRISGLEAARLLARNPKAPRIVFLTVSQSPLIVEAAMQTGALGYVFKVHADTELVPALRAALSGRSFLSKVDRPGGAGRMGTSSE